MTNRTSESARKSLTQVLRQIVSFNPTKTHDFRKYRRDVDYAVDFADAYSSAQMTTSLKIEVGEYILLKERDLSLKYYVEAVDYYWDSDSLRTIQLKRIQFQN